MTARAGSPLRALAIRGVVGLLLGVSLALFALPFAALALRVPPGALLSRLGEPAVLDALRLSVVTSLASTAAILALGLPLAWLLAFREFRGKGLVESLVLLPMVLPPTVAGLGLLLAFGRAGLAGRALGALGVSIPFSTLAVVIAQVFMAAPFFVLAARAGFASVERRHTDAAAALGASESYAFFRVVLPLSAPALVAGLAMSAARALGEFGATITFAGNLPDVTQTMPLAVYVALQSDLESAVALALVLVAVSIGLLALFRSAPAAFPGGSARAARRAR